MSPSIKQGGTLKTAPGAGTFAPADRSQLGTRFVYIGDSIDRGSATNTDLVLGESWPLYFSILTRQRALHIRNAGIGGQRSDQILARMDADVFPYSPQTVFLGSGTNDYLQGYPLAFWQGNVIAMVNRVIAYGAVPVLRTIPPHNLTQWHQTISTWNAWIKRYAASRGISILDFHGVLVDPTNGTYNSTLGGADNIHPNSLGYLAMAQHAVTRLSGLIPASEAPLATTNTDPNNLLQNALFYTDSNADGVPDNWAAFGGSTGFTHSIITASDVLGKLAKITMAAAPSLRTMSSAQINIGGSMAVGDLLQLSGIIGAVAGSSAKIYLNFSNGASSTGKLTALDTLTRDISPHGVFCATIIVPGGTTSATVYIEAGAGTGSIEIGQMTLYNLTKMAIA